MLDCLTNDKITKIEKIILLRSKKKKKHMKVLEKKQEKDICDKMKKRKRTLAKQKL